jgi:hypothetical protein
MIKYTKQILLILVIIVATLAVAQVITSCGALKALTAPADCQHEGSEEPEK